MIDAAERDGRARARRADRRADQRQHRDRAGDGLRRARLRAGAHPARGDEPRAHASCCAPTAPRSTRPRRSAGWARRSRSPSEIVAERGAFMPQQFSNPANPEIHRRTTAEEIWRDLDGEVDALVSGVGTGGTITGVGQVLKERRPGFHVVAVEPAGVGGALGRAARARTRSRASAPGSSPRSSTASVIDEVIAVDDEAALAAAREAARREGAAGRDLGRRRVPRRARGRRPPGDGRQADRHDRLRRRRALHVAAILRRRTAMLGTGDTAARRARDRLRRRRRARPRSGGARRRHGRDPLELGRRSGAARPPGLARALRAPACRWPRGRSPSPAGR